MNTLRTIVVVVVLSAVAALLAAKYHPDLRGGPTPPLGDHETDVVTALTWSTRLLWVDVRATTEFTRAHIPGALSLDPVDWEARLGQLLEQWHSGTKTVVYCDAAGCDLSKQIAARLRDEVGLPEVYFLRGGWEAWQKQHP